jgi:hypothetical protein
VKQFNTALQQRVSEILACVPGLPREGALIAATRRTPIETLKQAEANMDTTTSFQARNTDTRLAEAVHRRIEARGQKSLAAAAYGIAPQIPGGPESIAARGLPQGDSSRLVRAVRRRLAAQGIAPKAGAY